MNEARLIEKFKKKLKRKYRSAFFYKIPDSGGRGNMSKRPFDAFCIIHGFAFAFEFKIEPNKLTKYQNEQLNQVTNAGGISMKVTDENWESCIKNTEILLGLKKENFGYSNILQQKKKRKGVRKDNGNTERTP